MAPLFTPWKVKVIPGDPALESVSLRNKIVSPISQCRKKKSFVFDQNHLEKQLQLNMYGLGPLFPIHREDHVVLGVLSAPGKT